MKQFITESQRLQKLAGISEIKITPPNFPPFNSPEELATFLSTPEVKKEMIDKFPYAITYWVFDVFKDSPEIKKLIARIKTLQRDNAYNNGFVKDLEDILVDNYWNEYGKIIEKYWMSPKFYFEVTEEYGDGDIVILNEDLMDYDQIGTPMFLIKPTPNDPSTEEWNIFGRTFYSEYI
jgi:hypothetical protein